MTEPASTALTAPSLALGEASAAYEAALTRARDEDWATRLFDGDATLWTTDERVGATINERLGWLDAPEHFGDRIAGLEGFGDGIVEAGFTTAVVAGMGGSSLAPDVLRRTFGTQEGYLDLRILDSTDPAAVAATVDDLDPLRTLIIVASKSGTTTEPNAFLADAWDRLDRAIEATPHHVWQAPGAAFVAITDPGRSLQAFKHHDDFREVFLNPEDIGGRYSALTYVGLVPASLIGLDLDALLASALAMLGACREPEPAVNPGLSLGLALGSLARGGRDKLTFLADDEIASFGAWAEQLIAESTGKHGVGIVPVDLEPLGDVTAYGSDRAFVRLSLAGADAGARDALADALRAAGHPVIRIELADPIDIGARVRPLGGRDRDRGSRPRDRPVRPAERRGGQAAHARAARVGRRATGTTPPPPPHRWRAATGSRCTATRPSGSPAPTAAWSASWPATSRGARPMRTSRCRRSSRRPRPPTPPWRASGPSSATAPGGRRPPATGRGSCTPPASCTRAAHRAAGSSS